MKGNGFFKRLLSILLLAAMLATMIPMGAVNVLASTTYDPDAAVAYAKEHCANDVKNGSGVCVKIGANDNPWWCAEFVYNCLKAGNFNISGYTAQVNAKAQGEYLQSYGTKIKGTVSSSYINKSHFNSSLQKGDVVVIVYDNTVSSSGHVMLYSGDTTSDGNLKFYAHNSIKNNETFKLTGNYLSAATEVYAVRIGATTSSGTSNSSAQTFVDAALAKVGTEFENGYCLRFVAKLYQATFGGTYTSSCCAYKHGSSYVDSSSRDNIPVGACVFFTGSSKTCSTCGNKCGHIGIYVGNGYMVHGWGGKIVKTTVDYVINSGYPYRGWGWQANVALGSTPAPSTSSKNPDSYPVLERDLVSVKTGDDIKWLQSVLVHLGYSIAIDGSYGPESVAAVEKFQSAYGLSVDGQVGPNTRAKLKEVWASKGHTWVNGKVVTAATCSTAGKKTYECKYCEKTKQETIAATGSHSWNSGVITNPATCTMNGSKTYTCTGCGTQKAEAVAAKGHSFGSWQNYSTSQHKRICSSCSTVEYSSHSWNSGSITKQPTCTATGVKTYTCSVCNGTKTETIAAKGHSFGSWQNYSTSQHKRICSSCSTTEYGSHSWNSGSVTKAATHTAEGVKTYTCTVCSGTKTEAIAKLSGHTYGTWQKISDTQHKRTCACGASETASHSWNSGVVTKEATPTAEGVKTYTCTVCNGTKTEVIPKLASRIITLSSKCSVHLPFSVGEMEYFSFTPTTSGKYVFYSIGSDDLMVYLYDMDYNKIAEDDDGGEGLNFRLEYNFTAGTTYICGVKLWAPSDSEEITLRFGPVYTVSYQANGGSDAPSAQGKDHGKNLVLSDVIPTRSGYTFIGWATNSDATTARYQAGGTYTDDADITLYAVWSNNKYTVTYDANGGSGAPAAQTETVNTELILSSDVPTKQGYIFVGWGLSSSASEVSYQPGDTYRMRESITLYALWQKDYTELDASETAPTENSISLFACNEVPTYVGTPNYFVVDREHKQAGSASLSLTLQPNKDSITRFQIPAVDGTGYNTLEFDMYVSDLSLFTSIEGGQLELTSSGKSDIQELNWRILDRDFDDGIPGFLAANKGQDLVVGWNHIVLPLNLNNTDFDISNVNFIGFYIIKPSFENEITVKFDNFRLVKREYERVDITDGSKVSGWKTDSGNSEPVLNTTLFERPVVSVTYKGDIYANGGWSHPDGDGTTPTNGVKLMGKWGTFDVSEMNYFCFDLYVSDADKLKDVEFFLELTSGGKQDIEESCWIGTLSQIKGSELVNGWNHFEIALRAKTGTTGGETDWSAWDFLRIFNKNAFNAGDGLTLAFKDLYFCKTGEDAVQRTLALIQDIPSVEAFAYEALAGRATAKAARACYDALLDAEKAMVGANALAKLEAAEEIIANAEAVADNIDKRINALDDITRDNYSQMKIKVQGARLAYDSLNRIEKAYVSSAALAKLETAERKIYEFENEPVVPENADVQISLDSKTAAAGTEVRVPIMLDSNIGFSALIATVSYDTSVMELVGVLKGALSGDLDVDTNLVWSANADMTATGLMATLVFEIVSGAPKGNYDVTLIVRECYDTNSQSVTTSVTAATITVSDIMYGDANGDGNVNGQDLLLLRKYLANYNYDTNTSTITVLSGADANGDGKVNGQDLLLLRKYLANYNYDTGESTIVLGPVA